MSGDWIKEILDLVRQTGDRLVVTDPDGKDVFVVMDLENYKQLRGYGQDSQSAPQSFKPALRSPSELKTLTEDQLLNRINREIAVWKDAQFSENSPESSGLEVNEGVSGDLGVPQTKPEPAVQEEKFYFEPVDDAK